MGRRLHRTQILLESEQHRALAEISRKEQRSIPDLVREILAADLRRRNQEAQVRRSRGLQALAAIRQHRDQMLARRGGEPIEVDIVELINRMRDERDHDLISGARRR